jgi:hypothetical protein
MSGVIILLFLCAFEEEIETNLSFFGGGWGGGGGVYSSIAWEVTKNLRIVLLQAATKNQLLQDTEQSC